MTLLTLLRTHARTWIYLCVLRNGQEWLTHWPAWVTCPCFWQIRRAQEPRENHGKKAGSRFARGWCRAYRKVIVGFYWTCLLGARKPAAFPKAAIHMVPTPKGITDVPPLLAKSHWAINPPAPQPTLVDSLLSLEIESAFPYPPCSEINRDTPQRDTVGILWNASEVLLINCRERKNPGRLPCTSWLSAGRPHGDSIIEGLHTVCAALLFSALRGPSGILHNTKIQFRLMVNPILEQKKNWKHGTWWT